VSEDAAIAAGMAEFRKSIRPRLRVHAIVLVLFAGLVAYLAKLPVNRAIGTAGLAALALWLVLAWVERTWLPANLRDRYRRSRAQQP
jgi:hypothetical protein